MSTALLPMDTRRQLLRALKTRYQAASKAEKTRILEEFILISGYHRKSAIRLLNGAVTKGSQRRRSTPARSVYGAAVQQALIVLWEASDRLCGKRLKALLPQLIPAMEKHGHLCLNPALREQLLKVSASSIDRLLKEAHTTAGKKRNRVVNRVSKSIPVRMFTEHERHSPGFMEMDLVAHCSRHLSGTFLWTLSLTDIASGWTECVALPARNAELIIRAVDKVQKSLPFPLLGLDVDNGAEFINEALFEYCSARCIALTRSRPYRKNDQAWIEQKNGSLVRKLAGYGRLDGEPAVKAMNQMYMANFTEGHRRTLQRRLQEWRVRVVRELVYGTRADGNILAEARK